MSKKERSQAIPCRRVTRARLKRRAAMLARRAGYPSAEEAFRAIDRGELSGTLLEAALRATRWLLGD